MNDDVFNNRFVARDESFAALFASILFRARARRIKGKVSTKDTNPLTAMCSGPGGGKTRFLDEVANLFDGKKRNRTRDQILLDELFTCLAPISITYTGTSIYDGLYDSVGADEECPPGLALRVLFE